MRGGDPVSAAVRETEVKRGSMGPRIAGSAGSPSCRDGSTELAVGELLCA